jgi:hypothetical protein
MELKAPGIRIAKRVENPSNIPSRGGFLPLLDEAVIRLAAGSASERFEESDLFDQISYLFG